MNWGDIYDIRDDKESMYIHSHWENFDYIMKRNVGNINLFAQEIKQKVEYNLKQIVFNMMDREIA